MTAKKRDTTEQTNAMQRETLALHNATLRAQKALDLENRILSWATIFLLLAIALK